MNSMKTRPGEMRAAVCSSGLAATTELTATRGLAFRAFVARTVTATRLLSEAVGLLCAR